MFEIKNIKISLKIEELSLNSVLNQFKIENISFKIKSNYIIIKDKFVFIFFKSKNSFVNHINITQISNINFINDSIELLKEKIFKTLPFTILKQQIDNLTATCDVKKEIDQVKILNKVKNIYNIRYNKEKFPGLFVKVGFGTFIIFHTGKVNLVGCQNLFQLPFLFDCLTKILD